MKSNVNVKSRAGYLSLAILLSLFGQKTNAEQVDIFKLSLQELLDLKVVTASNSEEKLIDAPAAMVIITEQDFRRRNYHNLSEILADLPGFDTIEGAHNGYINFYQRGYRTPLSTRTLLMINGVVDNHLWSQAAILSRQYPISNIERIEVLYGPASVVYGANAFLGIINIITKSPKALKNNQHELSLRGDIGSWKSTGLELSAVGKLTELQYSFSAKWFSSDEEDLSDRTPFLSNDLYGDTTIWGPLLELSNDGKKLGQYYNPTDDWGILADVSYRSLKAGVILWDTNEGFGANYAADRAQANADWNNNSRQFFIEHHYPLSPEVNLTSKAIKRSSRVWGNWAEAEPDWREGLSDYSFISYTHWNTTSDAMEFKQDLEFQYKDNVLINSGWRYLKSDVTKAYDVPGYWAGSYSSTTPTTDIGPYGYGAAIFYSTDPIYTFNGKPLSTVPDENREQFNDKGVHVAAIIDTYPWKFNVGIRYDTSSLWGSSTNPRVSTIYNFNDQKSTIKLIYGEAFQAPPAQFLYGGWTGRKANPNLLPETAKNIEIVFMHQGTNWLHDMSLYSAKYDSVVREDAINDAKRDIWGFEYRGKFIYPNIFNVNESITGHLYYTYTHAQSSLTYNHLRQEWHPETTSLGDIAPHKVSALVDIPINNQWHLNLRGNFVSQTPLYSHNPLSAQGIKLPSRALFDMSLNYQLKQSRVSIKVKNILDRKISAPGLRQADAGLDNSGRSKGYNNSLTPLPGRSIWLTLTHQF
ncbi:TonB-dependent receptor plug domain-containing protein [Thalassotalea ganghwensis]